MADSRPIKAILAALAESPVPVAEAHFDPEGNLTKVVLAPRLRTVEKKEPDYTPIIAKPTNHKKTAIGSLREIHEGKMSSEPEHD